ncbi:MAG: hypothetical protein H6574_03465 [Lewinellaceae bacterium]|nr:hypothetical protein [Saprospiraceae bacterium]MCB9330117.1 hypothetical protein [Lewinellaceae bacterium]
MKNRANAPVFQGIRSLSLIPLALLMLSVSFSNCKSYKARRNQASSQIELLKDHALLVRLNTKQRTIDALKKANMAEEANYVEARSTEFNRKLVDAFRQYYTFSNVYFFYSGESTKLKNGEFDQVQVFDTWNHTVSNPAFLNAGYLVAGIGKIYQDIALAEDSTSRYLQVGMSGLPALVFMDKDYVQLAKPFPHAFDFGSEKKFKPRSIFAMNKRLTKYYSRAVRRKHRSK